MVVKMCVILLSFLCQYLGVQEEVESLANSIAVLPHYKAHNLLNTLRIGHLKIEITPGTGDFKPTTLTCALFTLKSNIKSPNYFYELKFFGNTKGS
jgi:hypothetical protein